MYNWLVFGLAGSGKTNLITSSLIQAAQKGIHIAVYDIKRDYPCLIAFPEFSHLLIFRIAGIGRSPIPQFPLNPLQPDPFIDPKQHAMIFAKIFCAANLLLDASEAYLLEILNRLYSERGIYAGSQNYPCINDLLHYFENNIPQPRKPEYQYHGRLTAKLKMFRAILQSGAYLTHGLTASTLSDRSYVLLFSEELAAFRTFYAAFDGLIQIQLRKQERSFCRYRRIHVLDECKNTAPDTIGEKGCLYSEIASMSREFNIGTLAADQEPTKVSSALFANAHYLFFSNLSNARDLDKVISCTGIREAKQRDRCYKLMTGEFVLKRSVIKPCTVLLTTPYLPITKEVTDTRIAAHLSHLLPEILPLLRYASPSVPSVNPTPARSASETEEMGDRILTAMSEAYQKKEWLDLSVPKLLTAAKMKRATQDNVIAALKQRNLVTTDEIKITAKGGATKFLEFTEAGVSLMNSKGTNVSVVKPGVVHQVVVTIIEKVYIAIGAEVFKEKIIGNQRCDLEVTKKTGRAPFSEIIEVALSNLPEDLLAKTIGYIQYVKVLENHTAIIFVSADSTKAEELQRFITNGCRKHGVVFPPGGIQFKPAYEYFARWKSKPNLFI